MIRATVLLVLAALAGCVTRDERPPSKLAEGCLLNSDCEAPLVCVFRRCHQPCADRRDCPADSDCQLSGDPPQLVCTQVTCADAPCPQGQVCGVDRRCRYQCATASDCSPRQTCVENQCVFKHSARSRPLNASMNTLSVGLPGRLKSSVTLFL